MRARPRQLLTGSFAGWRAQRKGTHCWQPPTPEELPILVHTYTVSVVVDNLELTDDVLEALFAGIEDVVPSSTSGVVKVTAPVPADGDHAAALRLVDLIQAALPQAIPVRLDQDLVSITDIAVRSARSLMSVAFPPTPPLQLTPISPRNVATLWCDEPRRHPCAHREDQHRQD